MLARTRHPSGAEPDDVPALVTLHVWGVRAVHVPWAVTRMAAHRGPLRGGSIEGLRFAKLLGTGDGVTFAARDADLRHWGLLATWADADAARRFESTEVARAWRGTATETLRVRMRPLASRGSWSGRAPFGDPSPLRTDGAVAALTRARIKPRMYRRFWSSVPPVSDDLGDRDGLRLALGVGEAPVGLQGTFSLWRDARALREFAHQGAAHQRAVEDTTRLDWYAEELFARFAVDDVSGTYRGRTP